MKNKILSGLVALTSALLLAPAIDAQQNELGWTMERAVKQLDRQGSDFESVLADADVQWKSKDGASDRHIKGRIYINGRGEFRLNTEGSEQEALLLHGRTLYEHDPAAATVKTYALSKHKNRLEPFVPLGFSTTGKDLSKDFLVTFIGEQEISGRRALGLELTPKKDSMREVVSKIELWVDQASWLPARQVITQSAGGETMTVTYTGTARNLALNPDLFKDNWPRGTKKVRQ